MLRSRAFGLLVAGIIALPTLVACGTKAALVIEVDHPEALVDKPLHIRVTGAAAGEAVEVSAFAQAKDGKNWRATARFKADAGGTVDLTTTAPESGGYSGVDGMGLFWSMNPEHGEGDEEAFIAKTPDDRWYEITLSATAGARAEADRTVRRVFTAASVVSRQLTVETDGVLGIMFTPPAGSPKRPGILLIGGSDGGPGPIAEAALLASHGYPTLEVGYFAAPGVPKTLNDIPLEYFANAARLLGAESMVDGPTVISWGYSRGTEPAIMLANFFPELVRGVVLNAPAGSVNPGFPKPMPPAWTLRANPVPAGPLPVSEVTCPVLAIAGGADTLWPSQPQAESVKRALDAAHPGQHHDLLVYPGAGHTVGIYPYVQIPIREIHPVTKTLIGLGGTRAANAAAQADVRPKLLAFLSSLAATP